LNPLKIEEATDLDKKQAINMQKRRAAEKTKKAEEANAELLKHLANPQPNYVPK
jgi:hypothetical protein